MNVKGDVRCAVQSFDVTAYTTRAYKYIISVGMTEVFLDNEKVVVKLLKLLGKRSLLFSCIPGVYLRKLQEEWQNET